MSPPVSLQRCPSYAAEHLDPALDALLAPLGGLEAFVSSGQRVILKPNLLSAAAPETAACTHPALLEALARRILALGATPIIGDSPAWGGPVSVAAASGVAEVCERLRIEFVCFDQHARLASRYPRVAAHFHCEPRLLEADVVINVAKLKSHQQLGFTGAVKNLYGCLSGRSKAWHHLTRSHTDANFARYIVAYATSLPVKLHVVDGILAMEGRGPRLGTPRELGVLAAGIGAVEVDRVLAELIGLPASHCLLLDAARELGAGETDLARIPLAGDPLSALRVTDFRLPPLVGTGFSPLRILRGWLKTRRMWREEAVAR